MFHPPWCLESSHGDDNLSANLINNSYARNPEASHNHVKDGGGVTSNGDWGIPRETDRLQLLREALVAFINERQLKSKCALLLPKPGNGETGASRFQDSELNMARSILRKFLQDCGIDRKLLEEGVEPGQPFWLGLIEGLLHVTKDVDTDLIALLREGVVTGIRDWIPASGVWSKSSNEKQDCDIRDCENNWKSATEAPELLDELISMEVKNGFLVDAWRNYSFSWSLDTRTPASVPFVSSPLQLRNGVERRRALWSAGNRLLDPKWQ